MTTESQTSRLTAICETYYGKETNTALFYGTIGPVQEFIAEAGRTRDLWAGSYMLARATFETLYPIIEHYKTAQVVILPKIEDSVLYRVKTGRHVSVHESIHATLPNHFLAVVLDDDINYLTAKMNESLKAYIKKISDIKSVIEKFMPGESPLLDPDVLWDFQLQEHFHFMWVSKSVSLDMLRYDYQQSYKDIQMLMEQRKTIRTFNAWQGSSAEKCPQCGHRELIGPCGYRENRALWAKLRNISAVHRQIKQKERLCAVCLSKRIINESLLCDRMGNVSFPSTSDIAVMPVRLAFQQHLDDLPVSRYLTTVKKLGNMINENIDNVDSVPGDWFYKETFNDDTFGNEYGIVVENNKEFKDQMKLIQEALNESLKYVNVFPSRYYALICLDADRMGKYLSGEMLTPGVFSLDWQNEQSRMLSEMSRIKYPEIISQWHGRIIYSGGDDLLAFGPLTNALTKLDVLPESCTP